MAGPHTDQIKKNRIRFIIKKGGKIQGRHTEEGFERRVNFENGIDGSLKIL